MRPPRSSYPSGSAMNGFFMSREAYERMLRCLVCGHSDRIKWVTGIAMGLQTSNCTSRRGNIRVDAIVVRLVGGEKSIIPSTLAIGMLSSRSVVSVHY